MMLQCLRDGERPQKMQGGDQSERASGRARYKSACSNRH